MANTGVVALENMVVLKEGDFGAQMGDILRYLGNLKEEVYPNNQDVADTVQGIFDIYNSSDVFNADKIDNFRQIRIQLKNLANMIKNISVEEDKYASAG